MPGGAEQANFAPFHGEMVRPVEQREQLEVVNAANEVVGLAPREDIHRRGLMHRSVHVFLFDHQGRLFIQKRGKDKDRYPLRYDSSAAGHVAVGEPCDRTAERELLEELGVTAPLSRLASFEACAETGWEHVVLYTAATDAPVSVNRQEIEGGLFLTMKQIGCMISRNRELFTPDFIYLFSWYKRNVRSPKRSDA